LLRDLLSKGSADESFQDVCHCIDAFDDDFHDSIVSLFCTRLLETYDSTFPFNPNKPELKYDPRFVWFKNRIEYFNSKFQKAFPEDWEISFHISKLFCEKTCESFKQILDAQESPNVKEYLSAFEKTVKFENKLCKEFSRLVVLPFDPDAVMPDFGTDAAGIKKKYEWLKRQEEGVGEVIQEEAKEFKGLIGSAFAPHLALYLQNERQNFEKIISQSGKSDDFDEEDTSYKLQSETKLILAMRTTIDKCAGFGDGQALLDLFVIIKEKLGDYVHELTKVASSVSANISKKSIFQIKDKGNKLDKELMLKTLQKECYIFNTTTDIIDMVGSLCKKIQSLVPDDFKEAIIVMDSLEAVGNEIQTQLEILVKIIIKVINNSLVKIGDNSWVSTDPTLKLPIDLTENMDFLFEVLSKYLTNDNRKIRFSPLFASKIVEAIRGSLLKCKNLSPDSIQRILVSVQELKSLVLYKTEVVRLTAKQVQNYFNKLEGQLTAICAPEIAIVPTYFGKVGKSASKEEFQSFIKIRGFGLEKEIELGKEFDKELQQQNAN